MVKICYNIDRFIIEGKVAKMDDTAMEKWSSLEEGSGYVYVHCLKGNRRILCHKGFKLFTFNYAHCGAFQDLCIIG